MTDEEKQAKIEELEGIIRNLTSSYNNNMQKLKTEQQKCIALKNKCQSAKNLTSDAYNNLEGAISYLAMGYDGYHVQEYKSKMNSQCGEINKATSTLSKCIIEADVLLKKIEKEMSDATLLYEDEVRNLRREINSI